MAKKPINMKFEADLLARVDAAGAKLGLNRTAFFTLAAEERLLKADTLKECARLVKEVADEGRRGGIVFSDGPLTEQTIKREPTDNALKRQVGFENHAKQAADGPVDVASLDIASWGFKRPVAPKKGK